MNWSPLNVLLLLLFGAGVLAGLAGIIFAALGKRTGLASVLMLSLAGWVVVYLAAVFAVSTASHEVELARGQPKRFCGFYIDCHLSVTVETLAKMRLPVDTRPAATGTDVYSVNIRVSSDAKRETLTLHKPGIRIVDDGGHIFYPWRTADDPEPLSHPLAAGTSYSTKLFFELPPNLANPRLVITEMEGVWPDRLFEMFLIGDEDSVLHKKTTLQI